MALCNRAQHSVEVPRGYVQRESWIVQYCAGKSVLHLGCIGENECSAPVRINSFRDPRSLHSRLEEAGTRVVGVDLDPDLVTTAASGSVASSLIAGNVETLETSPLTGQFDVIVAGDLIEHLSNPGLMLESIKSYMAKGGTLIVTTPNAHGLFNNLRFLAGSFREGEDHVLTHNNTTLSNLLQRHRWRVTASHSCYQERGTLIHNRVLFKLGRMLIRALPRLGGTLLIVAVLETQDANKTPA